ncbi:MAG: hypothetical protein P8170_24850 [Gemmatimonadota bacterium]
MEPISILGVVFVHLALVSYGVGIVTEQRSRRVTARVLRFLQGGVVLDVIATSCMIMASGEGLTIHGYLGFSALAAMASETALAWRHRAAHGDAEVPRWLHWYSRCAYGWWCVAYVAGAAMVMRGP